MKTKGEIAYGDLPLLEVLSVRTLEDNKIELRFSTDETGIFDMTPLLEQPAFVPLKEKSIFDTAYVDFGTVLWLDGEIDVDPETLYDGCVLQSS